MNAHTLVTSSRMYIVHKTVIAKNAPHPNFCGSPKWCRVVITTVDIHENTAWSREISLLKRKMVIFGRIRC